MSTILDREDVVKDGKYLRTTPLGEVVNGLMCDKFKDIVDTSFTANMEKELDEVEDGHIPWKELLRQFYGPFHDNLEKAEHDLEGQRLKVPDEESDEVCDVCGRKMVIKSGRFGRFLACQMANAVYDSISAAIAAGDHEFRATSSNLKFSGYTAVYEEGKDVEKEEKPHALPPLTEGQGLHCRGFEKDQHFTQPPAR